VPRVWSLSRKTGCKIFNFYKDFCLYGLEGRARSPYRNPNKTPLQAEKTILKSKRERRAWDAPKIPDKLKSPFHDSAIQVTQCGRICIGRRKIHLSTVFAGQYVGIREIADRIWLVSFMDYDLGFFGQDENRVEPVGENPFAPKVLPM
jgi:hypothetical protein